jgi:outer membrane lipoprotein LolB
VFFPTLTTVRLRHAALVLVLATLSACSTITLEPLPEGLTDQPPASWADTVSQRQNLKHWQLTGKIAVKQPSDSGSALINQWIQHNEAYDLILSSAFLGIGRTRLKGSPDFIELILADGESYQSSEPDELILAATGWRLPLNELTWWVRGLTSPDGDFRLLFDSTGELVAIRQSGWHIQYDRWYSASADLPALPARITATKGEKRVRMAITDWQPLQFVK